MTTNAAFKIRNVTAGGEWSAFSDRGFDCDHGDELEVQLEHQPALDVRTGVFSSVSSSKDAPDLTYSSSGVLATAASTITITVPAASPGITADSWIVRSQTNGGEAVLVNGQWNYTINTAERMISVRSGGLRKIIATERDQYSEAGGWADAQNEEVEVFGSGLDSVTSAVSTLTASVSAATSGITSLTTRVSTEESTRASADTSLTTRLSSEESARASADTSLETRLSTPDSSVTSLDARVSTVESRVTIIEVPGNDFAYLPPRMATATNATYSRVSPGSSYTHGISFYVTKECDCLGIMGVWSVSGTEDVRGELWSPGGASLANESVSLSASGLWQVTFGTPVTLTPYQLYHATQCVSGSNAATTYNHGTTGISTFSPPIAAGHGLFINSLLRYNTAANTFPNTMGAAFYPVAPILG